MRDRGPREPLLSAGKTLAVVGTSLTVGSIPECIRCWAWLSGVVISSISTTSPLTMGLFELPASSGAFCVFLGLFLNLM